MRYVITPDWNGWTVKDFLKKEIAASSRLIAKMKQRGDGILVNGYRVTVRFIMKTGDILDLTFDDGADNQNFCENAALLPLLDIIYEDPYIICVNKPANMPTHPSRHHYDDTLANMIAAYYRGSGFVFRAANRLDADTSGLVLIAKDKLSSCRLNEAIKNREIAKTYTAVVCGNINNIDVPNANIRLSEKSGGFEFCVGNCIYTLTAPIRRESEGAQKRICASDGDQSETKFKVLSSNDSHSTLEVYPTTGRTHQIRVHLSELGYPIIGDALYGEIHNSISRQALHSSGLRFRHPHSGVELDLKCPLSDDLMRF